MEFDEKLFLELCKKYNVEVVDGIGKNTILEDGVEKEITDDKLRDILISK